MAPVHSAGPFGGGEVVGGGCFNFCKNSSTAKRPPGGFKTPAAWKWRVRFTIDRVRQANGLHNVVEPSIDLVNWGPANGFSHTSEFAEPGFRRLHFECAMAPGEQKQFLRIRSMLSSDVGE